MATGRPKKNIDILPEGWNQAIENEYIEGASDVEVKALIYSWLGSFSNDLWDRWMKEEPIFYRVIVDGRSKKPSKNKSDVSDVVLKKRARRKSNRDYKKEYRSNKLSYSARSLLSYHLKRNGKAKSKKTFDYFGYSPQEYVVNIKKKLKPGMTIGNYGLWHVDHIKPLSMFDLTIDDEIKKAWSFDNLQCLWADENLRKSNKYGEE